MNFLEVKDFTLVHKNVQIRTKIYYFWVKVVGAPSQVICRDKKNHFIEVDKNIISKQLFRPD